jgi:uncharacterized membrane protein YkvA (DUF1232 family)
VRVWEIVLGVAGGLLLAWLLVAGTLLAVRPRGGAMSEAVRLLPDLLRLVTRLARDRSLPGGVRLRLVLLGAYLAMPFDLVPDFIPVLGYADDAIVVAWTLRSVARRVGPQALRRHWPGTDDGYAAVSRLVFGARGDAHLPRAAARRVRPAPSWWVEAALLAGLAGLTAALAGGALLGVDLAVRDWSDSHRPHPAKLVAQGFNHLGQGSPLTVLALLVALLLGWRRHSVRPLLPVAAGYLLTGATILPFKLATHRAPPHNQNGVAHPERLFSDPASQSYPSGHAANTIVWYAVLAILLAGYLTPAARRALRVAPPAIVCVTTTYLGYHWLTDTVAGLLLGLLLGRLLGRVRWNAVPLGRRLAAAGWAGPAIADGPPPPGMRAYGPGLSWPSGRAGPGQSTDDNVGRPLDAGPRP